MKIQDKFPDFQARTLYNDPLVITKAKLIYKQKFINALRLGLEGCFYHNISFDYLEAFELLEIGKEYLWATPKDVNTVLCIFEVEN